MDTMIETEVSCRRCGRALSSTVYMVRGDNGREPRCLRCALMHVPLLRRSAMVAVVAGTVVLTINQGNVIAGGDFPPSLYWKIPLTFCVPFIVATVGALLNARSPGD